jgi:5-methylcytosine-specific restriction endonuclease McrA
MPVSALDSPKSIYGIKNMKQRSGFEIAAHRMEAFLRSKPRSHKTREYIKTLPKRTPERDAARYAEWVIKGKPPSPGIRRDRIRPRAKTEFVRDLARRIAVAQNMKCALCAGNLRFDDLSDSERVSLDHVVPKARGGGNYRNYVAMHRKCNGLKADRRPTGCEMIMLSAVNAIVYDGKQCESIVSEYYSPT